MPFGSADLPLKISSMREEEKVLKQKLSDAEKAKKQLQSEVTSRERSIQQLRIVSDTFSPSYFNKSEAVRELAGDLVLHLFPDAGTAGRQQVHRDGPALPEGLRR